MVTRSGGVDGHGGSRGQAVADALANIGAGMARGGARRPAGGGWRGWEIMEEGRMEVGDRSCQSGGGFFIVFFGWFNHND
jgi:hypothetical protein